MHHIQGTEIRSHVFNIIMLMKREKSVIELLGKKNLEASLLWNIELQMGYPPAKFINHN